MKHAVAASAFAAAAAFKIDAPVHDASLIASINADPTSTWVAGHNPRFDGYNLGQAAKLCGTIVSGPKFVKQKARKLLEKRTYPRGAAIPVAFDARTAWPSCANITGHIRDQSDCGSCWAFGTTEALNDRMCIANGFSKLLSPQDTASCCDGAQGCSSMGCDGGFPDEVWANYFTTYGVVTGGDYPDIGTGNSCFPYQLPDCAHHEPSPRYPNCSSTEYPTPACPIESGKGCTESTYGTAWKADKHKAKKGYTLSTITDIQTDIMTYGTATATFTVYKDFLTYKSGVYTLKSTDALGGHAVAIVGWGVDNGVDYWTVKNSWNADWGNKGFFNIRRGTDECGIEDDVSAGQI